MSKHNSDAGQQYADRGNEVAGHFEDEEALEAIEKRRDKSPAWSNNMPHVATADVAFTDFAQIQAGVPCTDKL